MLWPHYAPPAQSGPATLTVMLDIREPVPWRWRSTSEVRRTLQSGPSHPSCLNAVLFPPLGGRSAQLVYEALHATNLGHEGDIQRHAIR